VPFSPPNLKSYVCSHVFAKARPVLLVANEDGDWSFTCGQADHGGSEDYRVVGVGHVVERDPSLNECADLPSGFEAEREAVGKPWLRTPIAAAAS
jgi:hypothetical protein